jgi:hypothetical protein
MGKNNDPRYNVSGCLDLTAYAALRNVEREETREDRNRISKLLAEIFKLCDRAGFTVVGRITFKDKKTGKVWR